MIGLSLALAAAPPVVGGAESEAGKWPSIASPFYDGLPGCTGVLVHPQLVLTAGHCDSVSLDAVLIGAHDRTDLESGEFIAVTEHVVHDRAYDTLDATLLVLETPATTPPAELAIGCAAPAVADGAEAWVVGYGSTDSAGNTRTDRVHEVLLPIVDADCDDPERGCNSEVSPGGELIAGGEGLDSCTGDSGGPLYVVGSNGRPYLAGITSRAALPASVSCGDGGIYVRLDALQGWIEQTSGQALLEPDCETLNRPPAPENAVLSVWPDESASLHVPANDPDPGQDHTWSIVESPALAEVWFEGSTLHVTGLSAGRAPVVVQVDDGLLAAQATISLQVVARDPEPLHACAHSGLGGLLLALLTMPWVALRSRAGHSAGSTPRRPRSVRSAG